MYKNLKKVAIVGRTNVGKSTLFNRIIQKRSSITSDVSGVTRDRLYKKSEWLGREFTMIDTGGYTNKIQDFQLEINKQVDLAIEHADIIIFLVSAQEGIQQDDITIANKLKRLNKKVILVVNKSDNKEIVIQNSIFYKLGFKSFISVSSIHGIGISNLLDEIVSDLSLDKSNLKKIPRIGIIGKPNVGKSTLLNKILNDKDRVIVSSIPGTTRDSIDTFVTLNHKDYIFTDTAGIKKNKKSLDDLEWYSELRTQFAILNSDIIILVIDLTQGMTKIDEKIMGILNDEYKPTIAVVNKSEEIVELKKREFKDSVKNKLKFAPWIPIIFISAKTGNNLPKLFTKIEQIDELRKFNVSQSKLNEFLMDLQLIKKPPRHTGREIKLTYITFINKKFPHFIIFSNYPDLIHFTYQRFIENQIRNVFDLEGIPIKISFRSKY